MPSSKNCLTISTVIAHRGLSSEAPENTLAAIITAANRGLEWIEVDVKMTADRQLILCHDETLQRTTNGSGKISESNWEELSKLDAGSWFSPKFKTETLAELKIALEHCLKLNLSVNLELKPLSNQIKPFVKTLVPIILRFQKQGVNLLISSFNKDIIKQIYNTTNTIQLGYLIDDNDDQEAIQNFFNEIDPVSIHLPKLRATKEFITEMKKYNKPLLVYTINSSEEAKALFESGVDAVFSDYPLK